MALGLLAPAPVPVAAQGASETQEDARAQSIPTGASQFTFDKWEGPALPVWTYVPKGVDVAKAPILIVMHGARRNPDDYRNQWIKPAKAGGFIVIAPGFSREDFPKAAGYNLGSVFEPESDRVRKESEWAFSAIEPLFDEVVSRLGSKQKRYSIYGHSAGSQFVHRFAFFKPEARVKRYMAANAGWYTFADPGIAFPHGLGGAPIAQDALKRTLAKDLVVLLGDADSDPNGRLLNQSEGAMKQGPHRFARGNAFFEAARDYARSKGWAFGWSRRVVKGVAHSNANMAPRVADLVE